MEAPPETNSNPPVNTNLPKVFERHSNHTFGELFVACHEILTNYRTNKEKIQWIEDIEPGRLLDALRLYIGLCPEAKTSISDIVYRSEHATMITRWLKLVGNKSAKSISTHAIRSANSLLNIRSPEQIVASIRDADVKVVNSEASEVFRYSVFLVDNMTLSPIILAQQNFRCKIL